MPDAPELYRHLPAVAALVDDAQWPGPAVPAELRTAIAREAVARVRSAISSGSIGTAADVAPAVAATLAQLARWTHHQSLRPLLNGSGVLLHTNAGRSPLHPEARAALVAATSGYNTLELDPATGKRGSRHAHCRPLLRWLTGAEDAIVVNNGAAAVLLAVRALAAGRPVVVARSQLVEIGGGFRVPEVLAVAGCRLIEVGATNRVRLDDYRAVLARHADAGDPVAAVLQVHRSNFALVGFAAEPELADIAEVAHRAGARVVVDMGSGALHGLPIAPAALPDGSRPAAEPTVAALVAAGADLVTFSGDKLVGGPQAGVCVGRAECVAALAADPLARAVRVGGAVLAALQATVRLHAQGRGAELPALTQLHKSEAEVALLADRWAEALRARLPAGWQVEVAAVPAQVGGGTHPLLVLPSRALTLAHAQWTAAQVAERALSADPPVLGRVVQGRFGLDVRSLWAGMADPKDPQDADKDLIAAIAQAVGRCT
ncbi:MAG: L-seryl-tRNA(Sec) selenium transferase [Deltaproteobacteria bacterium]|nr:L-seryl-tRNA(Sec) selenium transferase [Deltaproteobacteria bacterium]